MADWTRIREIFEQVVELPASERDRRLVELCDGEPELLERVERLLAEDASTGAAAIETPAALDLVAPDPSRLREVGKYRIVRVLGSGGMGTVFEARQDKPQRTVALKVLRAFIGSEMARRRLEYEAETLGRLHHPNIAQIHESGTWRDPDTGEESPFFAMEFVEGAHPLDEYADRKSLDLRGRLELFLKVCDAVHHGHQQGVLHRDLKPQNVLVGSDGRPKVIDFGIARATDVSGDGRTMQTLTGQVMGTVGYMSPEQIDGDPKAIDVRADVYSLGATLYELLTGRPPYERGEESLAGFLARMRNQEAPRPSTCAGARVVVPADLDWVILRALAIELDERYPSVSGLAADLRRFLADEPVSARPPTTGYLLRKFVRRNRALVTAVTAVMLAMVIGTILTAIGWRRAVDAEEVADNRRTVAEQLAEELWYLTELQTDILTGSRGDRNTLMVDVLERASARLQREPPANDRVAAGLHSALASAFLDLGITERSKEHFEAALARIEDRPSMQRISIRVRGDYSSLLYELGRFEEAEQIRRTTLRQKTELWGEDHWRTAWGRVQLGIVLTERGQYREAVQLCRRSLPVLQSDADVEDWMVISGLTGLANALTRVGEMEEAARHYEEARAMAEREFGPEDPETLKIRNSQALLLMDTERLEEAESIFRELWEISRRVRGPAHPSTARAASNLALCAERRESYAEAEAVYREMLRVRKDAGKPIEAIDLIMRFNLVVALHRQEDAAKLTEALAEVEKLLADAGRMLPEENWRLAVFRQHRGTVLRKSGRYAEAERDFAAARAVLEERLGPRHSRTRSNYEETAALYEAWGRAEEAARWRARLDDK